LELPETDGKHAQSSAGGMTGKMGTRPFVTAGHDRPPPMAIKEGSN